MKQDIKKNKDILAFGIAIAATVLFYTVINNPIAIIAACAIFGFTAFNFARQYITKY
jgi:hypothetical protein